MSRKKPPLDPESSHRSDTEERLTSAAVGSRIERDKIDPLVDQWLQELVRVALAIAARDGAHQEGTDGSTIET